MRYSATRWADAVRHGQAPDIDPQVIRSVLEGAVRKLGGAICRAEEVSVFGLHPLS